MQGRKNKNLLDIVPIYSPRTTYNQTKINDEKMLSDMTLNFDKKTISLLKKEFEINNGQIKLDQFINFAKKHLKFWQPQITNRQNLLIRYLTQLFNQIDINGNGDMEWKQFTNYVIQKATVLKNLKKKQEQIKRYVKSDLQPKLKVDGMIHKAEYIDEFKKIAVFEEGSSKIYFMDIEDGSVLPKPLQIDPKKLIVNISSVKKTKKGKVQIKKKDLQIPTEVKVLDILYLSENKYKTLLVSTNDGYVRGWKYTQNGYVLATQPDNQDEVFQHHFNSQIYCMAWDNLNEVLYCGQKSGNICLWNLKTDLQKVLQQHKYNPDQKDTNEKKISLLITSMITMPKLQFMASGRMDGKLILWDTINNKKKWTYREHSRGIMSLAFNQGMILLFSAGFDHKICVWNPYIQTLIHRLQIHLAPILTLRVIESSNQLISLDSEGVVKVTDTKRFNAIYSFSIQKQESDNNLASSSNYNLSGFIVIDKPLKLIFLGKTVSIYQYDKNYNPLAADQNYVVAIEYIQELMSFITASGNKIKVWSALNGDITKIFIDISEHEITALALDSLKKRMIIGDIQGNISVHNVLNGAKIKHLSKHNTQISSLIAIKNDVETLISCSTDNQIRIFKETDDIFEIVRYIYFRKDVQISHLEYETNIKLIMVGTNVGTIGVYDPQTGKNVGNCLNKNLEEITSLCSTNQSIIIATTSTGKVNLFGIPPANNKFQKLLTFTHHDCQKNIPQPLGILISCYDKSRNFLFVIDDKMFFTCYDLSQISVYRIGVKSINSSSQSFLELNKRIQKLKFRIKWQTKTNHDIIKCLNFISQVNILCTSSFDKKVKLWDAQTGEYIDSLQQNYNKSVPEPIAYYDTRKFMLITKNRKQMIDQIKVDLTQLQSDPQKFQKFISQYEILNNQKSNNEWNLKLKFVSKHQQVDSIKQKTVQDQFKEESSKQIDPQNQKRGLKRSSTTQSLGKLRRQFVHKIKNDIAKCQEIFSKTNTHSLYQNKKDLSQLSSLSVTPINNDQFVSTQKELNIISNQKKPKLKRGMMKCIQNCLDSQQKTYLMGSNEKQKRLIKSNLTKSRDFIPIYQVLAQQQQKRAVKEHQNFVNYLHKAETLSFMNSRQQEPVYLSNVEAKATQKLCNLLLKIDNTDKRPKSLLKNIKIKSQVSQSLHSSFSNGFPKI